jgi:hypothetical protein
MGVTSLLERGFGKTLQIMRDWPATGIFPHPLTASLKDLPGL